VVVNVVPYYRFSDERLLKADKKHLNGRTAKCKLSTPPKSKLHSWKEIIWV
jgi:hypothetical protein